MSVRRLLSYTVDTKRIRYSDRRHQMSEGIEYPTVAAVRTAEFDWADWEDEPECSDSLAGPIAYDPQRYDEYPGWDAEVED